ncbi:MAG: glycosyltransferase, partial [Candidatus Omnitrophica bacterium]|nr:glycosyltransferase [Candidatus Omnitrophota bacterium]
MTAAPIRILYIIDKLLPAGTQMDLLRLVRSLDRGRFCPYVVALQTGGQVAKDLESAGVKPVILDVKRAYDFSGLRALGFLVRFMRQEKIDIVQLHFLQADMLGTLAAKLAGVKKIITTRRDEGFWMTPRQRMLSRFFGARADCVLANSEAVKKAALDREKLTCPVRVIHNGVEMERYAESSQDRRAVRAELGLSDDEILIGVIANMRHRIKGYEYLLEAVPQVLAEIKNARFLFVGDGDLRPDYEARAAELGVSKKIIFIGSRRDTVRLINAMDIACLSSLTEGFSNALLEYMACGKPVIATDVGGNPEIVGTAGILVPPKDSRALADAMTGLARNGELRASLGREARQRIAENFTVERTVAAYQEFYEELLQTQVPGPRTQDQERDKGRGTRKTQDPRPKTQDQERDKGQGGAGSKPTAEGSLRRGETATRGEEKRVIASPPIPPSDGTPPWAVEAGAGTRDDGHASPVSHEPLPVPRSRDLGLAAPQTTHLIRVCHLIWALEAGGAERQVVTMALWQKRHGFDPRVVCLTRKGLYAEELEKQGVSVTLVEKRPGLDFSIVGRLAAFLKENSIDVLHAHVPTANFWGRLAAAWAGVRIVFVHEHSALSATDWKFRLVNWLLVPWTTRYIAVSGQIGDALVRAGIPGKKVVVARNGIPIGGAHLQVDRAKIRAELAISDHTVVVGTVGRLENRKDHA